MIEKKEAPVKDTLFLKTLKGKQSSKTPIWFMRQAGRYLPEYLQVRSTTKNFLEFCYNPEKAAQVTLQPITRFDFDAAIIFSDILVIPDALGMNVKFIKNEGPKLQALKTPEDIENLQYNEETLHPVYEALLMARESLAEEKSLIGFAGAPWTLATYMIEGQGSKDYLATKKWAYQDEESFTKLIDKLTESVSKHLIRQVKYGADALQLFDSWAGVLTPDQLSKWVIEPAKKIINNIKSEYPDVPVIGFPRGVGLFYKDYAIKTGVDAISFDQNMPCRWIKDNIDITVQGNLDPVLLLTDKNAAAEQAKRIVEVFEEKSFVFNLGHGILQHTPIENVEAVIKAVRG